jgi:major intrinsic protein
VPTVGAGPTLVYEGAMTVLLMFVVVAVATDTRATGSAAAIAIGATVGLDAIFGGDVTGASMNPARSVRAGARVEHLDRLLDLSGWADRRSAGRCGAVSGDPGTGNLRRAAGPTILMA